MQKPASGSTSRPTAGTLDAARRKRELRLPCGPSDHDRQERPDRQHPLRRRRPRRARHLVDDGRRRLADPGRARSRRLEVDRRRSDVHVAAADDSRARPPARARHSRRASARRAAPPTSPSIRPTRASFTRPRTRRASGARLTTGRPGRTSMSASARAPTAASSTWRPRPTDTPACTRPKATAARRAVQPLLHRRTRSSRGARRSPT